MGISNPGDIPFADVVIESAGRNRGLDWWLLFLIKIHSDDIRRLVFLQDLPGYIFSELMIMADLRFGPLLVAA